jgi:hypothetical protein
MLIMLPPGTKRRLNLKFSEIELEPNNPAESELTPETSPNNNLSWRESILKQIEKTGPIIAEALSVYLIPAIEKIGDKLAEHLNHLSELKALQKAYENQWILSTSQLSELLHIDSKTILNFERFQQHGFIFSRQKKMLSEIGWKVSKSSYGFDDDD